MDFLTRVFLMMFHASLNYELMFQIRPEDCLTFIFGRSWCHQLVWLFSSSISICIISFKLMSLEIRSERN